MELNVTGGRRYSLPSTQPLNYDDGARMINENQRLHNLLAFATLQLIMKQSDTGF